MSDLSERDRAKMMVLVQAGKELQDVCKMEIFEVLCEEGDGSATMDMLEEQTSYSRRSIRLHVKESELVERNYDYGGVLVQFVSTDAVRVRDYVSVALNTNEAVEVHGIQGGETRDAA